MQGLVIQPVRLASARPQAWRPALAQAVQAAPVTPPNAPIAAPRQEKLPFIDSALMSLIFSALGTAASGILTYGAAHQKSKLAYLLGAMTGALALKTIADLSEVRER